MNTTAHQLFVEATKTATVGRQGLSQTAHLTDVSETAAKRILSVVNSDQQQYAERVQQSMKDNGALDKLIDDLGHVDQIDTAFLAGTAEDELERMLKSQQSKRSRSRAKVMTADNYVNLLTAAISEDLIRRVLNKEKSAVGGGRKSDVGYTDEELKLLSADPEKLAKAIRNVQSKKSIMKSKAGFDENSVEWQTLLTVEQQLKELRGTAAPNGGKATVVVTNIKDLLGNVDLEALKSVDSKDLLKKIHEALNE